MLIQSEVQPRYLITGGSGFIGTNLIEELLDAGLEVCNLDLMAPLNAEQHSVWFACNILDREALRRHMEKFAPTHVIHLAARTDCDGRSPRDYLQNTEGTRNVLVAASRTKSIQRMIVTSTQFVCQPGYVPASDEDFSPHTAYGESKIAMERMTRAGDLPFTWTIVRPTTIWGPWLLRHERQVFRALRWGTYMHPGRAPVMRSWGYVGNAIFQLRQILDLPTETVDRQVLYIGDEPLNLLDWVNAFSRRIRGRNVRVVPRNLVRGLAWLGDAVSAIGIDAPLTTSRFRSMTQDYLCPMDRTFQVLGEVPYSMEAGVDLTMRWLARADCREGEFASRRCPTANSETLNDTHSLVNGMELGPK